MSDTVTLSELVASRKDKQDELKELLLKVKVIRKQIRDTNKQIQINLDFVLVNGGNPAVSPDNHGWQYQSKEEILLNGKS